MPLPLFNAQFEKQVTLHPHSRLRALDAHRSSLSALPNTEPRNLPPPYSLGHRPGENVNAECQCSGGIRTKAVRAGR